MSKSSSVSDINGLSVWGQIEWFEIGEGVDMEDVAELKSPTDVDIYKYAIQWSDAVIKGSENLNTELEDYIKELNVPVLEYQPEDSYIEEYNKFYDSLLSEVVTEEK